MKINDFLDEPTPQIDFQALSYLLHAMGVRESIDIDSLTLEGKRELLAFVNQYLGQYSITKDNAFAEVMQIIWKEKIFFVLDQLSREHGLGKGVRSLVDELNLNQREKALSLIFLDPKTKRWDILANTGDIEELFGGNNPSN